MFASPLRTAVILAVSWLAAAVLMLVLGGIIGFVSPADSIGDQSARHLATAALYMTWPLMAVPGMQTSLLPVGWFWPTLALNSVVWGFLLAGLLHLWQRRPRSMSDLMRSTFFKIALAWFVITVVADRLLWLLVTGTESTSIPSITFQLAVVLSFAFLLFMASPLVLLPGATYAIANIGALLPLAMLNSLLWAGVLTGAVRTVRQLR